MAEHGPSEKAFEAARGALVRDHGPHAFDAATKALAAAHDPALGLDRSVCLRDVLNVVPDRYIHRELMRAFTESSSPDREGESRGN